MTLPLAVTTPELPFVATAVIVPVIVQALTMVCALPVTELPET